MTWPKLLAPHREDRTAGFSQDGLCHAAGQGMRDPAAPVRTHNDEVARQGLGRI